MEERILDAEQFEEAVGRLLADEAERRRPDRRGPRGNGEPDERDVAEAWAKLRRVLG